MRTMGQFSVILALLCSLLHLSSARPNGAPVSSCRSMTPGHGSQMLTASPYTVDSVGHGRIYTPGVPMQVRISGPVYRGFLLQARRTDGSQTPVGRWTAPSITQGTKTISCSATDDSVTHADTITKQEPVFTWTPPNFDVGPVKFIATVAATRLQWWRNIESPALTAMSANPCASNPCRNGGTCNNGGTFYTCTCTFLFIGTHCENRPGVPPPPTGQNTRCAIDLVFIMDTSDGAINNGASSGMQNFMSNLAGRLAPGSNVGLVIYGSNAEKAMDWTSAATARNTLRNVNLRALSATNTNLGVDMARTDFFNNRRNNPQFAILVSEGPPAGGKLSDYRQACQNLKNTNTRIMVVGVLINSIAQSAFSDFNCHYDNSYIKYINNFQDLTSMATEAVNLMDKQCRGGTNRCSPSPCMNGGTCRDTGNDYQCSCTSGWMGKDCNQQVQDPCTPNPCRNNGQCNSYDNNFYCTCFGGSTGPTCSDPIDPCSPNPCNNGQCSPSGNSPSCSCYQGWTGTYCDQQDRCNPNPCRYGTCRNVGSSYACDCFQGYTGTNCDQTTTASQCTPNPCMNFGTCVPSSSSYICQCTSAYVGTRCQIRRDQQDANEVFLSRFENGDRVGLLNDNGDNLDWQTTNNKMKPVTGPKKDGSEDTTKGDYAYIMWDRNMDFMGKNARYITQEIQGTGAMCLEFKYWMTGGWDKIRILLQRRNGQVIGVGEFNGNKEYRMWVRGQVTIEEQNSGFKIIFEALPFRDYSLGNNVIALDDIRVLDGGICAPKPAMEGYYYRIVGGPSPFEGRVEVSRENTTDSSMWGGLCMSGFGTLEAQLLCAKIFPGSEQLLGFRPGRTISLGDYGNPRMMVQDNINCYGQTTLDACMTSGWRETGCMLSESAKVRCDQPEFYYVGNELRLADYVLDENAKTFSGRLELFYNGQWGTVCSTGFDQIDAQAVCNTIGFKGRARVNANGANGQGQGPVFLENVNCPQGAADFTLCLQGQSWQSRCSHSQDVGVTCTFQTRNIPWTCSFENNNNCGFFPYSANDFEWMVGRPPVGSARGGNSVMYASLARSSGSVASADALYDMSIWISPMFEAFPTSDFLCVRFWYNPYDISDVVNSGNVFSIYMKMGRDSYPKFWLDARNIGVNRQWTEGRFTLTNVDAPFKLKFVAMKLVRAGRQSYIMLDDIRITEGSCTGEGYITSPGGTGGPVQPPVTPRPPVGGTCGSVTMSTNNVFECKFDSNDCSSYVNINIGGNNIMKWDRINNGPTQSTGTGPLDGNGGGGYIYLETSSMPEDDVAVLRVNNILSNNMDYCLCFDYHMLGQNIDTLKIALRRDRNFNRGDDSRNIYEIEDQKSREWNMEMVDVMTRNMGSGYLFVSAVVGNGYQGDIAIDNLKLRRGQCCPNVCSRDLLRNSQNIYNCGFEENSEGCCFRNCPDAYPADSTNRAYQACGTAGRYTQWARVKADTTALNQNNQRYPTDRNNRRDGYYLATSGTSGETSRLFTGMIDMQGGTACLRLNVYFFPLNGNGAQLTVGIVNQQTPIRTVSRINSNNWREEIFTITGGNMVQVYIDGRRTNNQQILIDDINISNGRC